VFIDDEDGDEAAEDVEVAARFQREKEGMTGELHEFVEQVIFKRCAQSYALLPIRPRFLAISAAFAR
jgi:hypothetical protein